MKIHNRERNDIADREEFALEFGRREERVNAFGRFAAKAAIMAWLAGFAWLIAQASGGAQ